MKVSARKRVRRAVSRQAVLNRHPGTAKGGIRGLKGRRRSSRSRISANALSGIVTVPATFIERRAR
jgi:hypothetical protein